MWYNTRCADGARDSRTERQAKRSRTDRGVLRREAERVPSDRMQHLSATRVFLATCRQYSTLAQHTRVANRKWLSRGRDEKPVTKRGHFEHLVTKYLPDHHGATWVKPGMQL